MKKIFLEISAMFLRGLRILSLDRKILQIGIAAALCGLAAAQNSKKPLSADVYYKRGAAKMNVGKCENAVKDFDRAIRLNPRASKFFLRRAECFDEISEPQKAIADFSRAIELKSDFAEAYIGRAKVYASYFEYDGEIRKALGGSEDALADSGKAARILADFNKAVEINPRSPDAYIARAKYYFQPLREFKSALADFDKAVRINSRDAEAFIERADFYFRAMEDYERALADSTTAIRLNPRDAYGYLLRAEIRVFGAGGEEWAIADYTAALKLDPNDSRALSERALLYRRTGKIRLAEADERRADKLYKASGLMLERPVMQMSGVDKDARKAMSEQELADSYIVFWNRAFSPDMTLPEIARLTKVLEANPRFVKAFFERGNHYLTVREFDKAVADYSQAINLDSKDYETFNNRGIAYARKGDYDSAIKDFSAAASLNSTENRGVFYNRGLALLSKGDAESAVADFTQFLKDHPKHFEVYRLRAKAYRKLGKIAEAEADEKTAESAKRR